MKTKILSPGATVLDQKLKSLNLEAPTFHVVLGSGFKDAVVEGMVAGFQVKGELSFSEVPGLHPSTAPGHAGKYVFIEHEQSKKVGLLQVGRLHGYEGIEPREVVLTVMNSRELGTELYFVTNAAGGMEAVHKPGDVMMILDHVNFTGKNPLFGPNPKKADGSDWGPRFQDLTKLYDPEWTKKLKQALVHEKLKVHEGVYMGVLGPSFETPAEIRFFSKNGTQAVGMSTVWETIALKHSGAKVCALSLISNRAAGLAVNGAGELEELDHFAILDACKSSSAAIMKGILKTMNHHLIQSAGAQG